MPYIVMRRSDIPNGVLQVVDLKPNTSQFNPMLEPGSGQSGYVRQIPSASVVSIVASGPDDVTPREFVGAAAYLIDNVEDAVSLAAVTPAVANAAVTALAGAVSSGAALTLAAVNAALVGAGAGAGTGLATGNSTGVLSELLAHLQGLQYVLPAGAIINLAGVFNPARSGSFVEPPHTRFYYLTGAFLISNGEGNLAKYKSASFEYKGVVGPAVVVYGDDGSVL
jgi:hypothetical protein